MKQNLAELQNNYSDKIENDILISKENNDHDFKVIPSKEKEIENLKLKLEKAKRNIYIIEQENISVASSNTIILLLTITLITILCSFEMSVTLKIFLPTFFYLITKIGLLCEFGTRKHRNLKLNELINTINELEKKILKMDCELQLMKEKTNFVSLYTTSDKTKYHNFSCDFPIDNENCINQNKVKVLSLTKK